MMAYLLKMIESLQGLVSGRIHKINQPENDTIIIVLDKIVKSSTTSIDSS